MNYNNRSYSSSRNGSWKKKSGCKAWFKEFPDGSYSEGLTAWRKSRGVFMKAFVSTFKNSDVEYTSKTGNVYIKVRCQIDYDNGNQKVFYPLMNLQTKKVVIKDLGLVLNPKKNYFGTYKRR